MEGPPPPTSWATGQQLGRLRGRSPLCAWTPEHVSPLQGASLPVSGGVPQAVGPAMRNPQGLLPSAAGVSAQVAAAAARLSVASAALQTAAAERAGIHQGISRGSLVAPCVSWSGGPLGAIHRPMLGAPVGQGPHLLRGSSDASLAFGASNVFLPFLGCPSVAAFSRGAPGGTRALLPFGVSGGPVGASLMVRPPAFPGGAIAAGLLPLDIPAAAATPGAAAALAAATAPSASAAAAASFSSMGSAASPAEAALQAPSAAAGDGGRIEQLMRCLRRGLVSTPEAASSSLGASPEGVGNNVSPLAGPCAISLQQQPASPVATAAGGTAAATAPAKALTPWVPGTLSQHQEAPQQNPQAKQQQHQLQNLQRHQLLQQQQLQQQQKQQQMQQQQILLHQQQQQQLQLLQLQIQCLQQQQQQQHQQQSPQLLQQQWQQLVLAAQQQQRQPRQHPQERGVLLPQAQQHRQQQQYPAQQQDEQQQQQQGKHQGQQQQQQMEACRKRDAAASGRCEQAATAVPAVAPAAAPDTPEAHPLKGRFCSAPWSRSHCDVCAAAAAAAADGSNTTSRSDTSSGNITSNTSSSNRCGCWLRESTEGDSLLQVSPRVAVAPAFTPQQQSFSFGAPLSLPSSAAARTAAAGPPKQQQQEAPLAAALGAAVEEADKLRATLSFLEVSALDDACGAAAGATAAESAGVDTAGNTPAARCESWEELLELAEGVSKAFTADCINCAAAIDSCSAAAALHQQQQECSSDAVAPETKVVAPTDAEATVAAERMLGGVTYCLASKLAAEGAVVSTALRCICTSLAACCAAGEASEADGVGASADALAAAPATTGVTRTLSQAPGPLSAKRRGIRGLYRCPFPLIRAIPLFLKGIEYEQQQEQQQEEQRQRREKQRDQKKQEAEQRPHQKQQMEQRQERQSTPENRQQRPQDQAERKLSNNDSAGRSAKISQARITQVLPTACSSSTAPKQTRAAAETPTLDAATAANTLAAPASAPEPQATASASGIAAATGGVTEGHLDKALVQVLQQALTAPRRAVELCRYLQLLRQEAERLLDMQQQHLQPHHEKPPLQQEHDGAAAAALLAAAERIEDRLFGGLTVLQRTVGAVVQSFLSQAQEALLCPNIVTLLPRPLASCRGDGTTSEGGLIGIPVAVTSQTPARHRRVGAAAEKTVAAVKLGRSSSSSRFCALGSKGFPPPGRPVGPSNNDPSRGTPGTLGYLSGSPPEGAWGTLSLSHVLYRSLLGSSAPKGRGTKRPRYLKSPEDCGSSSWCSHGANTTQANCQQESSNGDSPWLLQQQQQHQVQQQQQLLLLVHQQRKPADELFVKTKGPSVPSVVPTAALLSEEPSLSGG